jgi:hypothetical protein
MLHLGSSAMYSLGHGLNDAQKTMGIIAVLLYSTGHMQGEFHVPHWVALACYVAIGLGTLSGGWKIIETMGTRITKLDQHQGFSASLGGSVMLFTAVLARHSRVDDAHHHRLRDRRRRGPARICGALAGCRECHDRLGDHHPAIGGPSLRSLLYHHIVYPRPRPPPRPLKQTSLFLSRTGR